LFKVIWSNRALEDIIDITEFIAKDSKKYARLTSKNLVLKCNELINFPKKGKVVVEFKIDSIREIIVGNYRIIYSIGINDVNILTIHHSARSLLKRKIL